ncbi:MAG: FtsX-like permease family protein [Actinobacteria bacterium]|nr:FtsX-like permease family protein [Actinomycetota bacterium]
MRANFVLSGVATGVRRNLTMTIALVLSTAIALAFVGAAFLADREITKFKHAYESKLNVSVYLCPGNQAPCTAPATQAQTDALRDKLNSDPLVDGPVGYISQAEAAARYRQTVSPEVAQYITVGSLPASFTVKLKDIKADYDKFVAEYRNQPGVSSTTNSNAVLSRILSVIDGARLFAFIIAIVVLIASILLIANTIQVAAAQRRNETSIMRLVGASRWMTELPFMLETMIATLIGGVISLGLIWIGKHYVLNHIFGSQVTNGVIPNLTTNDVLEAGGVGLIAGLVLAAITAFATLRLYVRL